MTQLCHVSGLIKAMSGVWSLVYTNGYKDEYTIQTDGTVIVKGKGTTTKLKLSFEVCHIEIRNFLKLNSMLHEV